jgi:hypothetical protein
MRRERKMAGEPGFEPGLKDPKSSVLPLHNSPVLHVKLYHLVTIVAMALCNENAPMKVNTGRCFIEVF